MKLRTSPLSGKGTWQGDRAQEQKLLEVTQQPLDYSLGLVWQASERLFPMTRLDAAQELATVRLLV